MDLVKGKLYFFQSISSLFDDKIGIFVRYKHVCDPYYELSDYYCIISEKMLIKIPIEYYNVIELS